MSIRISAAIATEFRIIELYPITDTPFFLFIVVFPSLCQGISCFIFRIVAAGRQQPYIGTRAPVYTSLLATLGTLLSRKMVSGAYAVMQALSRILIAYYESARDRHVVAHTSPCRHLPLPLRNEAFILLLYRSFITWSQCL